MTEIPGWQIRGDRFDSCSCAVACHELPPRRRTTAPEKSVHIRPYDRC